MERNEHARDEESLGKKAESDGSDLSEDRSLRVFHFNCILSNLIPT